MSNKELTYPEFIAEMQREVREQMQPGVQVELHTAVKNNDTRRTGLVLIREGVNISPTVYLEEFYEQYRSGMSIPALVETVQTIYGRICLQKSYPYDSILTYDKVKDRICFKLVSRKDNRELLEQAPYETFLDLAVVCYVLIESSGFGAATLLIRREHLREWQVSWEEVIQAARENTPRLLPMEIEQLTDYMYVLTNRTRNMGAAALLYPGAREELYRRVGESYYLIPSSIHEFLAIPESYGVNREQLRTMLGEVNELELEEEEVLSDQIYYYCGEDGSLL